MELIDVGTARATALRQSDAALGLVTENRILTAPGAPEKRHLGMYMYEVHKEAVR
jgi:cytochrome P450/NADPH-cytochrome P450 reductase